MLGRRLSQRLEKTRLGRNQPLKGLDDHAGDLVGIFRDELPCERGVVEGRHQHAVAHGFRDARRIGNRTWEIFEPPWDKAHQRFARHAVVAALELQDLLAAGMGAGETHGVHVGLGAGADIAQLLGAGDRIADRFGELDSGGVRGEECHALAQLRLDHLDDLGISVAQQHRARADEKVDIFVAALVPDAAAATLANDDARVEIAETAGGQDPRCPRNQIALGIGRLSILHVRLIFDDNPVSHVPTLLD